jgi:hypothetical protein
MPHYHIKVLFVPRVVHSGRPELLHKRISVLLRAYPSCAAEGFESALNLTCVSLFAPLNNRVDSRPLVDCHRFVNLQFNQSHTAADFSAA